MIKIILFLILIFSPLISSAAEKVSCAYPEKQSHEWTSSSAKSCGEINEDGLVTIDKALLDNVYWNKYGLECFHIHDTKDQNGWYFVNQSGEGRIAPFWQDNDCAPFAMGLNVGLSKGKVVFYNQILKVVKRTDYVWASGFHEGYSKVCIGSLKKEYDSHGDHYEYKGGSCGYIDVNFKEVIPISYVFEKTPEPKKP